MLLGISIVFALGANCCYLFFIIADDEFCVTPRIGYTTHKIGIVILLGLPILTGFTTQVVHVSPCASRLITDYFILYHLTFLYNSMNNALIKLHIQYFLFSLLLYIILALYFIY
jgi:hypothetical protein